MPDAAAIEADHEKVARSVALRLLTSAPRSRAQLAEAMARKDVPDDVAHRVLDRLTDVGLVDDAEYAAILVRTRHAERGQARRAIAQELTRRGIDAATAQEALTAIDREDEDAVALDLVRRRAGASAGLPRATRERRLVSMLARKGHHPGSAFRIVREVLDEEDAQQDRDDDGDASHDDAWLDSP
ncbi:regulatory protein RecX [Litorihabitans aurantiacus]|uniref:regulatory protein RecX n=1 Tax=Litorihabitans aurantiacus TaxID=1930061 RepID=UPI0024E15610|nr:regulatory protein RecX [Litorihabitans aurantiacus]